MDNPLLYYYVDWPESQEWMSEDNLIHDGYVIEHEVRGAFVEKSVYEARKSGKL